MELRDLEAAMAVIDRYLLASDIQVDVVEASLQLISTTWRRQLLSFCNLEGGLPTDPEAAISALIQLRLVYIDEATPSHETVSTLWCIRSLYGCIDQHMSQLGDPVVLENTVDACLEEYRVALISTMVSRLKYELAMYDGGSTTSSEEGRVRIHAACLDLKERLQSLWFGILGHV